MSEYAAPAHPLARNPAGWYAVGLSHELAPGEVRPVSAVGRELVLFRTASGVASVLDAYCIHMGTHLGHGGSVDGECLRCPLHRWGYGVDGSCVDVPYARKIPPSAKTKSYPVMERNGAVLAWFHPDGAAPTFEVPDFSRDGWSPARWLTLEFPLHVQEIAENGIDIAHFAPIHNSTRAELAIVDAKATPFRYVLKTAYPGDGIGVPGMDVNVVTEWSYYGLGMFSGLSTAEDFGTQMRHLFHFTPVPDDKVFFRVGISLNLSTIPAELVDYVHEKNAELTARNLVEDAPIWQRKRYLTRPVLCDADGPYGLLRRWTRQFYPGAARAGAPDPKGPSPESFLPEVPEDRSDGVYRIAPEGVGRTRRNALVDPSPPAAGPGTP